MFNKTRAIVLASVAGFGVQAFAALPAGVDAAITGVQTDGLVLVGLMAVAGAAVYLIHKLLKKFGVSL